MATSIRPAEMPTVEDPMVYRIAMSMIRGMTVSLAQNLLKLTGTEREFFRMSDAELQSLLQRRDIRSLGESVRREAMEAARRECGFIYAHSVKCLYFLDEAYPQRLLQCEDAPLILYMIGDCDLNAPYMAAIVGTRHATPYGSGFTQGIIRDFGEQLVQPVTIVSGLAYGIDVEAHRAALEQGLPTVAVVAHGLDTLYPSAHRSIAARMVREKGGIVTEYPSGTVIHRANFLARNRIVAGMSDCVIVSESAFKGGALVTARIAGEYDREVFALPGRTSDKYSEGCNELIACNRAHLADSGRRIIDLMGWRRKTDEGSVQGELFPLVSPEEEAVIEYLRIHDNATTNILSINLGMPMASLLSLMIEMEFKGLIMKYPGGRYRLK